MIDRTASTCVNPDMVYEGLTNRCDGTTLRSMFNLFPCENTLWQCRAERPDSRRCPPDCNSWPPGSRNGEGSLRAEIIMNRDSGTLGAYVSVYQKSS